MTKCKAILRAILMGITFSIFSPLCVSAQEKESEKPLRPVSSVFTVELGRQSALDTYLTPIRYWGLDVALGYERLRAVSFALEKWFTRHNVSGSFASMTNQSGSGSMLSFYLDYSFAMLRRWQLLDRLYVSGGGEASLTLGDCIICVIPIIRQRRKLPSTWVLPLWPHIIFIYHDCR